MSWLWMNIPVAAAFFAAWSGIPLYMVLRHPSWGPERADAAERALVKPPCAVGSPDAHRSAALIEAAS